MGYRILMVEKTEEEYEGDHSALESYAETMSDILRVKGGHHVSVCWGLENITEDAYSSFDCVLIHPTSEQARRLKELRERYPGVGCVLTPGSDASHNFGCDGRDIHGTYMVSKPYKLAKLMETIDSAVSEARERGEERRNNAG